MHHQSLAPLDRLQQRDHVRVGPLRVRGAILGFLVGEDQDVIFGQVVIVQIGGGRGRDIDNDPHRRPEDVLEHLGGPFQSWALDIVAGDDQCFDRLGRRSLAVPAASGGQGCKRKQDSTHRVLLGKRYRGNGFTRHPQREKNRSVRRRPGNRPRDNGGAAPGDRAMPERGSRGRSGPIAPHGKTSVTTAQEPGGRRQLLTLRTPCGPGGGRAARRDERGRRRRRGPRPHGSGGRPTPARRLAGGGEVLMMCSARRVFISP